ncbi:hypothetical protein AOT81_07995 [Xylella fastidiosa]|nr:hypothetical protein AOT81_07995 [Xylella fastidiosa]RWA44258.1 hypothetical protein XfCFBP8356_06980 [Xylella fastidiosa subsp. sandyi]
MRDVGCHGSWVTLVFPDLVGLLVLERRHKSSVADVLHPNDPMDAVHRAVGEWICDQKSFTSDGAVGVGLIFPVH